MTTKGLPLHGADATYLDAEPDEATARLAEAMDDDPAARAEALRRAAAAAPTHLEAWARLAEHALDAGDPVAAYAFARTGYHRGLDRLRKAGWGGQGPVPSSHAPNHGVLRSVAALGRAAAAIGEDEEAERCRVLLAEMDPDDSLGLLG